MLDHLLNNLPSDILCLIKEYVLTPQIRLEMIYNKYKIDEIKFKKILSKFTSKQLEIINWKYIYYKIYKTSPPRCDNNNLVSIFDLVDNPVITNLFNDDVEYEPFKLANQKNGLYNYKLFLCVTRSDYYSENVKTEIGRKRQQYKNIVDSWKYIHDGNQKTTHIPVIDEYFWNMEFELIKALILLH